MSDDLKRSPGIEKWMGYVAILVATVAAFAALYEARMNREHQAISVWPYLQMWAAVSFAEDPEVDEEAFSFNIANKGVGPAILNDLKLEYRGKEYPSWYSLVLDVAKENDLDMNEVRATLGEAEIEPGEVVQAGEIRTIIQSQNVDLARVMAKAVYGEKLVSYMTCYCSLYKECWKLTFPEARPKQVDACEAKD